MNSMLSAVASATSTSDGQPGSGYLYDLLRALGTTLRLMVQARRERGRGCPG